METYERSKIEILLKNPKTLNQLLYNKYGDISEEYISLHIDSLIFSKNCHLMTYYKENLIWNYIDEFLKRYYYYDETIERVPKIANYYKNYLKFFCSPVFRNFKLNNIIQTYCDNRAELFYKKTYNKSKKDKEKDVDQNVDKIETETNEEDNNYSMLFNSTIKNVIDNYLLTQSNRNDNHSFLFSGISGIKNDLITKREDSILKILANLGEDINDRFKGKANGKYKLSGVKRTNNFSTTDKTKPEADGGSTSGTNSMFKKIPPSNHKLKSVSKDRNKSKSHTGLKSLSPLNIIKKKPSMYSIYRANPWQKETNVINNNPAKNSQLEAKPKYSMLDTYKANTKIFKKPNDQRLMSPPHSSTNRFRLNFNCGNSAADISKTNFFHQKNVSSKINSYLENSMKMQHNELKTSMLEKTENRSNSKNFSKNSFINKTNQQLPKSKLHEFLKNQRPVSKPPSKNNTQITTKLIKNFLEERSKSKKRIPKQSFENKLNEKTKKIINIYSKGFK
jgi:hypothetical protein